jgi:hypothetical protein
MIREDNVIRTPYRHPNHKSRYLKQSEYQYHLGQEQLNYRSKNIDTDAIKSQDNNSSWKSNILQRIELGWSDSFTVWKFCLALKGSYCLVSSTMTTTRKKYDANAIQDKEKDTKPSINMLWGQIISKRGRKCNKYKYH